MKNSPSSMVKVEDLDRVEAPEILAQVLDSDLCHGLLRKWLTMMNITVPISVTMKE